MYNVHTRFILPISFFVLVQFQLLRLGLSGLGKLEITQVLFIVFHVTNYLFIYDRASIYTPQEVEMCPARYHGTILQTWQLWNQAFYILKVTTVKKNILVESVTSICKHLKHSWRIAASAIISTTDINYICLKFHSGVNTFSYITGAAPKVRWNGTLTSHAIWEFGGTGNYF